MDLTAFNGSQTYHNFVRPHEALNGDTLGDGAGFNLEDEDKRMAIIENACIVERSNSSKTVPMKGFLLAILGVLAFPVLLALYLLALVNQSTLNVWVFRFVQLAYVLFVALVVYLAWRYFPKRKAGRSQPVITEQSVRPSPTEKLPVPPEGFCQVLGRRSCSLGAAKVREMAGYS